MMISLTSKDPERQILVQHKRRRYSIVDLTMFPLERDGHRHTTPGRINPLNFYLPNNYEVADVTDGVVVLGRYASREDALAAIKQGDFA